MSGPGFETALERVKCGDAEMLIVASLEILTVEEVVRVIQAGGKVVFANEDLVLAGTVKETMEP